MKELKNKIVYKCEYCDKISLSKGGMTIHERCCKRNPENLTPCASCMFLIREEKTIPNTRGHRCKRCQYYDVDYENYGYAECTKEDSDCDGSLYTTDFICEKTGKRMYYRKKVLMMRSDKRDAIMQRCDCAMPMECELHEEFDII